MRILIVTPYLPHARVGHGGGSAVRSLIAALARRHEVAVVSLVRPGEDRELDSVRALGATVVAVPFRDRSTTGRDRVRLAADRTLAAARALATGYPYYVTKYASEELVRATIATAASWRPDVIQVEYLQLALLLRTLRQWRTSATADRRPRLVLDSHELGSLPRRRQAATATTARRAWLLAEADAWDRLARDASQWADTTLCVTDQDQRLYAEAGGRNLVTVPLGIDTRLLTPVRDPDAPARALFVGSFQHPPNREAAALLCDTIWPLVRRQLPDWELVLAGPGSDVFLDSRHRASPGIRAAGFVPDLTALFATSRLFVAPLVSGGGIKIKILEALARGIPVITTPIGAEGIVTASDDLVGWAEAPKDFAATVIDAAADPTGCQARADAAHDHVERLFSWDAVVTRLETVYAGAPASGTFDSP